MRVFLIAALAGNAFAQLSPQQVRLWEEANRQVLRVDPSAFTELPSGVLTEIHRRGCTIPQPPGTDLQNVIKGEFTKHGETDWAVLCSVNWVSSILIFWNGAVSGMSEIEKRQDVYVLTRDQRVVYTRLISPVSAEFIMDRALGDGGPKPPPLDHQGINDAFLEKGSAVQYFYNGEWQQLAGDD